MASLIARIADLIGVMKADFAALDERVTAISRTANPNAAKFIVGNVYDNAFHGTNAGTLAGAANRVDLAPFSSAQPFRVDLLGVTVSTAVAGALGRCFIYGSNADGWPDELLWEGGSNLDFSSTGYKGHALDFVFEADRRYWLGIKHSSTATIRSIATAAAFNLGLQNSTSSSYNTILRRTHTFANAMPANWGFLPAELAAGISPPSIRFRVAAL